MKWSHYSHLNQSWLLLDIIDSYSNQLRFMQDINLIYTEIKVEYWNNG